MRTEFTLYGRGGARRDLVVTGHPAATWGQALAGLTHGGDSVFRGSHTVDLAAALGTGAIVDGDVVSVGQPQAAQPWPLESRCLAVVGGAAAGTLLPLGPGEHVIGRSAPSDLVIDDPTVSARHATLLVAKSGEIRISDLGSRNGTFIVARRLNTKDKVTVAPGERFTVGQAVVTVLEPAAPDGSVVAGPDGARFFNRVLRYDAQRVADAVEIPEVRPDDDGGSAWLQYVGSLSMLVAGVGSAVAFNNYLYAGLGALGPLVLLGTTAAMQRRSRRRRRREDAEINDRRSQARAKIRTAAEEESAHLWTETLDPARAQLAALGPTSDLWSVDATDPRAMMVRVGTSDRPAGIEIRTARSDSSAPPTLVAAPVTVDLRATPVMGIAGEPSEVRGVARALVHQIAATRSPDDLFIYHLATGDGANEWSWLRWLPHTRAAFETIHTVSPSSEALKARLDELTALVDQRKHASDHEFRDHLQLPEVLVVLEGAGELRNRNAVVKLLQEAGDVGVAVLALETQASRLPKESSARLLVDGSQSVLEVKGAAPVDTITVDTLSVKTAEHTARALASLRPLGGGDGGAMPRSIRFVELAGLSQSRESQIQLRWKAGNEGEATLGIDEHGNPCTINLVSQGPHALIAGTSGSGKSELLRTMVAGLALSASPQDLAFLLVDFKGGGAFGKLEHLPHVVGYADDQSIGGALALRLLDSLRAELDYRKTQFKAAGNAEGLKEYRAARARGHTELPPIARLVIVVDEFAELKEQQPEFVEGLVNVARTGRSLGVHLVLATQQPAGVVTPQIRDNANLRICLRVLDGGTSIDLVGTPLAASFSNRDKGRAVLVSGDAPPVVLQTAYVSAPVVEASGDAVPDPHVEALPWARCGAETAGEPRAEGDTTAETDLSELVSLMRDTAQRLGVAASRRPWLQPLSDKIRLADLAPFAVDGSTVFGLEDHPGSQSYTPLTFPLGVGNIGIAGGRASGRSTALRTLAVSLAVRHGADDLHLYVIDQSLPSTLRPLSTLPHTGVVATRSERYVTERLVMRLREELTSRAELLARRGHGSLRELRAVSDDAPPWIVVLVDGWDSLAASENEVTRDGLLRLCEEGTAAGIQFAITGGTSLDTGRIAGALRDLLVLRFDQRDDMAGFGVPVRLLPAELPPGRAFRPDSPDAVQIALLDAGDDTDTQNETVRTVAAGLPAAQHHRPMRIKELPTRISLEEAMLSGPLRLPPRGFVAAVGGDDVACKLIDLDQLRTPFVIAGPGGSGRTSALAVIAAQLVGKGFPLMCWRIATHDAGLFPAEVIVHDPPTGPFEPGTVVLVDNAHELDALDPDMMRLFEDPNVRLCLAGDTNGLTAFSGWKNQLRSGATGLLLSPQFTEGEIIGKTISLEERFSAGPGRAYLGSRGRIELVQIPLPPTALGAR